LILVEGDVGAHADPARTEKALAAKVDGAGIEDFLARLSREWSLDPVTGGRSTLSNLDRDFARALLLDTVLWDRENAACVVAQIRAPVLAIQTTSVGPSGRTSLARRQRPPWIELILSQAPNAQAVVLEGMGHFPHLEASGEIAELIANFAHARAPQR
jgi:pimeloyl-ACP methyl ester carboxylesterase